ncbi:MAG: hypothetical protein AAFY71_17545 [Bacteroidota bacterium]
MNSLMKEGYTVSTFFSSCTQLALKQGFFSSTDFSTNCTCPVSKFVHVQITMTMQARTMSQRFECIGAFVFFMLHDYNIKVVYIHIPAG